MQQMAPKYAMQFSTATKLGLFAGHYRFFSPALLYLFSPFNDDLLIEFLTTQPPGVHLMFHKFRLPIFSGMERGGDADWNYVLWAIESVHYAAFENFLVSTVMVDHALGKVYRLGAIDIVVMDPLFNDSIGVSSEQPSLPIVVFGVNGTDRQVVMPMRHVYTAGPCPVRYLPPDPSTVALTKYCLACDHTDVANLIAPADLLNPNTPPIKFKPVDFSSAPAPTQRNVRQSIEAYKKEFPS